MKKSFGILPTGEEAFLYTISCGKLTATVTDYGATLVSLLVPDAAGNIADVVLGHDSFEGYRDGDAFLGATVGRNANRIAGLPSSNSYLSVSLLYHIFHLKSTIWHRGVCLSPYKSASLR